MFAELFAILTKAEAALANPEAAKIELQSLEIAAPLIEAKYPTSKFLFDSLITALTAAAAA